MADTLKARIGIAAAVLTLAPLSWLGLGLTGQAGAEVSAVPAAAPVVPPRAKVDTTPTTSASPSSRPTVAPPKPAAPAPPPGKPPATVGAELPDEEPPAADPPPAPRAPAPARPAPVSCSSTPGTVRPTRFQVLRTGVNVPMVSVGKDADGNPGVAKSLWQAAWYTGSPAPGSSRGNVIINIHSNMKGRALGNDLHLGGLNPGDIIKVSGADGKVACYRFREKKRISVRTYDPRSGVYHNATGRPQLAIMTCWDRDPRTGIYESRIIFYADRIA
ncbi:class F sortase [Mariniluteicoccus flavus]